jgi:FAD/FMN-containing dehydrogenase
LVRWAVATRVALVPRGGGSGLMGGATVLGPALVVDCRRLDTVDVDADAGLVHAGAGATLARVDAALAEHGLLLGHDPWTVAVATVGGALGTNGLGYLGARAGSIGAQLRGIEAVLGDGTILRTPAVPTRSSGIELARLLAGSEGTLGIVTQATLAALPRPEERIVASWDVPSFDAAVTAATALRRAGVRFSCLEASADGLPPRPASVLLLFEGLRGEAALHAERAATVLREAGGRPVVGGHEQWASRHAIAERWAATRRGAAPRDSLPDAGGRQFDYAHVAVPLAGLARVREVLHDRVRRHSLTLIEEGLWHWPELYSVVVSGPPDSAGGVRAAIDAVCRAAQAAGGSMEYCHGVGWKLAHLMDAEHGADVVEAMRRVQRALDPAGILNPGKDGLLRSGRHLHFLP